MLFTDNTMRFLEEVSACYDKVAGLRARGELSKDKFKSATLSLRHDWGLGKKEVKMLMDGTCDYQALVSIARCAVGNAQRAAYYD